MSGKAGRLGQGELDDGEEVQFCRALWLPLGAHRRRAGGALTGHGAGLRDGLAALLLGFDAVGAAVMHERGCAALRGPPQGTIWVLLTV